MNPILVAHGTRKSDGVEMIGELADRVSDLLGRRVRTAFVDVLGPTPSEVLRTLPDDVPAVLVPAFLSSGYHVRTDLPAHVEASGHRHTVLAAALGVSGNRAHRRRATGRIWLAAFRFGGAGGGGHVRSERATRPAHHGCHGVRCDRATRRSRLRGDG